MPSLHCVTAARRPGMRASSVPMRGIPRIAALFPADCRNSFAFLMMRPDGELPRRAKCHSIQPHARPPIVARLHHGPRAGGRTGARAAARVAKAGARVHRGAPVTQPMREQVDLTQGDEALMRTLEAHARSLPGFEPHERWRARMAERMGVV